MIINQKMEGINKNEINMEVLSAPGVSVNIVLGGKRDPGLDSAQHKHQWTVKRTITPGHAQGQPHHGTGPLYNRG
jgi:hypothetical protein